MLILSRRIGETIVINQDIRVTVLDIKGAQVRIGVEAPRGIPVDRLEIADRKAQSHRESQATNRTEPQSPNASDQPLFANRTVDEWRELLAAEGKSQPVEENHHG